MEKKSLGRGLEDISSTFMTPEEGAKPGEEPSFLSKHVREKSCSDCLNIIEQPMELPKCKIFSVKNKEYGVPAMESILPGYAKFCRFFKPVDAGDYDNEDETFFEKFAGESMQFDVEVEETVDRHKKIAIQDDGNIQDNIKKMLSQHLEQGYEIIRINLEKKEEHKGPTYQKKRREEVTIFRKGTPSF